jgi:hypothetical protein
VKMALSTCIKCVSHTFELVDFESRRSNYKINSAQSTNCGGIAGILEFYDTGVLLNRQDEAIKKIAERLGIVVDLYSGQASSCKTLSEILGE